MLLNPALIHSLALDNQTLSMPEPISLEKPPYNEDWMQNLIHDNPRLVPAGEVEACFSNLVPILREFPLPSGYLDNFYITPDGYPVLVEVKLWKNQEARRKVVAQILEYAKDFSGLKYDDINSEIRKQIKDRKWGSNPLHEIVSGYAANPLDETLFVDRVSRNLREGRFLLLIVGDGIREEMAGLAQYLMHHSLRYAFGMIQIRLFTLPDGAVLALPEVLARTQTIERHVTVVTTQDGGLSVIAKAMPIVNERVEKTSLSLDDFYDHVARTDPANVVWIKELLEKLSDIPVETQSGFNGQTIMIKAPLINGTQLQLMLISPSGLEFWGVPNKNLKDPAWQKISSAYLQRIVETVPGSVIKVFESGHMDIKSRDKKLPLSALQNKTSTVADAMRQVLRDAESYFSVENTA